MTKKVQSNFHCPRCGGKNLIMYDQSFDCVKCQLEFEKKDLDLYDDEDILSIEEKLSFTREMKK
ncbi:MAG: hypothetical protein ACFFAS_14895 [Promethearchaeota archaeon]